MNLLEFAKIEWHYLEETGILLAIFKKPIIITYLTQNYKEYSIGYWLTVIKLKKLREHKGADSEDRDQHYYMLSK